MDPYSIMEVSDDFQVTGHTPGPWKISPYKSSDKNIVILKPGVAIDYDDVPPAEAEANAKLISAAPELLEALEAVLAYAAYLGCFCKSKDMVVVELANAAIARATGSNQTRG